MSEIVKVLGIDPSLRNTGLSIVTYNTETKKFSSPSHCQVLVNPKDNKKKDAIMNMLDLMRIASEQECYKEVDVVLVESPPIMFDKAWAQGTISSLAHISGGAVALFGIHRSFIFRPIEWNRRKKKEVTHYNTEAFLGSCDGWHYEKRVKSEKYLEHIKDAASMALWWIRENYVEEVNHAPNK